MTLRRSTVRTRTLAILVVVGLGAAACGNADDGGSGGGGGGGGDGRDGVSDSTIRVGGVLSQTNPIGRPYEEVWEGARIYFDRVNAEGGVFDREFELLDYRDDQSRASEQIRLVQQVVEEDDVFAVLPIVSNVFAAAGYLVEAQVPTFGWNIQSEWASGLNLFGEKGSFLCFGCPDVKLAWFAEQIEADSVAILSYGVPQSSVCAEGIQASMEENGIDVPYINTSLSYGFTDIATDARRIRDSGADLLMTCMDVNGNVKAARALQGSGIAIQSPEGYDPRVPAEFGADIEGFYFRTSFVPFEAEDAESPGMDAFRAALDEEGLAPTELLLAGWLNARLLHEGIQLAGEDFTRESVIDAINSIDDWTADGILDDVDWTVFDPEEEVRIEGPPDDVQCNAWLQVRDGAFVPVLGEPGMPFACHERDGEINDVTFR